MANDSKGAAQEADAVDPELADDADDGSVEELDLDQEPDLDSAMRDAVEAVEQLESRSAAEVRDELDELRQELDALRDRSARTLADFDNFRKRSERERQDVVRYAMVEPMRELLAVVDNLERALAADGTLEDLKTGVELTLRQMRDALRRQGVREIAADGEIFDPALHEAVMRREDPEVVEPRVVRELQRGYILHDRLLRPAIVEVAVPADGDEAQGGGGEGPDR